MFCCSKKMTPETFVQAAEKALGGHLRSAVLYGSAAAGDSAGKGAGFNVLLVSDRLDEEDLCALASVVRKWMEAGNPAPRMFTEKQLRDSCDVFPIEMLDMQQAHKLLCGADVLGPLTVSRVNLRHQAEFELRAKILALREGFVVSGGDRIVLSRMLPEASSPILSVLRAVLRLYQDSVPSDKVAALAELNKHIAFDKLPFERVAAAKSAGRLPAAEAVALFPEYLQQLDLITDAVNALQPS